MRKSRRTPFLHIEDDPWDVNFDLDSSRFDDEEAIDGGMDGRHAAFLRGYNDDFE